MPLAVVIRSGTMPSFSHANHWPVRQKPDWISSATKTMPLSAANWRIAGRKPLKLDEAALAEHRLDDDRGDVVRADLLGDLVDRLGGGLGARVLLAGRPAVAVGHRDAVDLGRERAEAVLVRHVLRGQRHRQVRTAVVAVVEDDDRLALGVGAGDLDGVLDGLGAGVEEGGLLLVVARRQLGERLGDRDVALVRRDHEAGVGEVLQLGGGAADHGLGGGADGGHGDTGTEVDEAVAVDVLDDAAVDLGGEHRQRGAHACGDDRGAAGLQLLRLRAGDGGDDAALLRDVAHAGLLISGGPDPAPGFRRDVAGAAFGGFLAG